MVFFIDPLICICILCLIKKTIIFRSSGCYETILSMTYLPGSGILIMTVCYRKILRISWTERKTNASVLEQLGVKAPQLLNLIKKQKLSYFGHIKRHNTLEKLFLEGTCEGRRGRGRARRRWTQDIGEWMGVSTVEAGRQALERGEFRQAVWEATSIKDPP